MNRKHRKADEALGAISTEIPFGLINPTNSASIQRRFLRKPFEPDFEYGDMPDTEALRTSLAEIRCGRGAIGDLLRAEKANLFDKIALVEHIGTEEIGKHSVRAYGKPRRKLVDKAYELLEIPASAKLKKIKVKDVQELLRKTFSLLGFTYKVRKVDMVASAAVLQHQRELHLKRKERFSREFTLRLCVHEIATHALRAENGRNQPLTILQRGTPDYLGTEEGLAVYNEERAGVMSPSTLRKYAGRVVAVAHAQDHTFTETYKELAPHFSKKSAFKLALRAKRGVPSGSTPGGCTKDHVYLKGYYDVKNYVAGGGHLDTLHSAKIAVHEVEALGKILVEPQYIPEPVIEWVRHVQLTEDIPR